MGNWHSQFKRIAPVVIALGAGLPLWSQCSPAPCASSGAVRGGRVHEAAPQPLQQSLQQTVQPAATESTEPADQVDASRRFDSLVARLHDRSSNSRVQAANAIAASTTGDQQTVNRVLRETLQDEDPLVADAALHALVQRGEDPGLSVGELERAPGENSELARVQLSARDQNTSALRELMRNGDAVVQEAAFAELAAQDRAAAVEALKQELFDRDSLYRLQTLELFARSPYTNSHATLAPVLEEASKDEDALLKERAEALLKQSQSDPSPDQKPNP